MHGKYCLFFERFLAETEEYHENLSHNSLCPDKDFKREPNKYEQVIGRRSVFAKPQTVQETVGIYIHEYRIYE